ncbi:15469_t:CDS:2 [Acaulospora colombiana]|uniref:15469_t:CDS:1 n=1 Tax=Acaulospora colombiana TaxID=27376 RepID=A0ACA9N6E3_9GLOM|nr:15469_t:CDS:2 [Acaulospora colombiana]
MNDTVKDSQCTRFFKDMDPAYTNFVSPFQKFEHPFIRIVMALQGSQSGVISHILPPNERSDYTTYDMVCRGLTHDTYKIIDREDEKDWKRCLQILGGYREYLKRPDGTDMSPEEQIAVASMVPGLFSAEEFPYTWLDGKEKDDKAQLILSLELISSLWKLDRVKDNAMVGSTILSGINTGHSYLCIRQFALASIGLQTSPAGIRRVHHCLVWDDNGTDIPALPLCSNLVVLSSVLDRHTDTYLSGHRFQSRAIDLCRLENLPNIFGAIRYQGWS